MVDLVEGLTDGLDVVDFVVFFDEGNEVGEVVTDVVDLVMDGLTLGTFVDFLEGKLLDFMLGTDDLGDVVERLELTFDLVVLGL